MAHQIKKNLGVITHRGGAEFRVWAPFAKQVYIDGTFTPNGKQPLTSEDDGYWFALIHGAEPGHQYKYIIETPDGRLLERNDPRARAITSSDKGFSVIVDNEFDWQSDNFVMPPKCNHVIYELHVGTFNRPDAATSGTFDSAIEKLDYLRDLGINIIELMPVTSMAFSNGWGYAPNHIFSVESMLGGRHGLMKFVRACHQHGIGVILDVVYNHFYGDTDLWRFDGWSENDRGGIYFYNDERGDTPWGGRPDYGRPEVRQFILDNVAMWLTEYHIDGLRVDSTIYMRNTAGRDNDPDHDIGDAWSLLQDIVSLAHKIKPDSLIIAEDSASNAQIVAPRLDGGCGFDSQWELGFPHALRAALGLSTDQPNLDGIQYEFNHAYGSDAFARTIFSDSHDTAANGSVRLNEAVAPAGGATLFAREKTLLANAVTLTSPGIPMLLQGSEFLQDGSFNDWAALEWQKTEKYAGIVTAHRHLLDLRHNRYGHTGGLQGQSTALFHVNADGLVIGYHRWNNGGVSDDVIVIANFSSTDYSHYAMQFPLGGKWHIRFNSSWRGYSKDFRGGHQSIIHTDKDSTAHFSLPAYTLYILSQE